MASDTASPETIRRYEGTNLWRPWMKKFRLRQITSLDELEEFLEQNATRRRIGWDVETASLDAHPDNVCGHCISFDGREGVYIPTQHSLHPAQNLDHETVWDMVIEAMEEKVVVVYNWMFEGRILRRKGVVRECNLQLVNDAMIYRWMFNSDKKQFNLKDAAKELCEVDMINIHETPGISTGRTKRNINFSLSDPNDATLYAAADPIFTLQVLDLTKPKVDAEQLFIVQMEHALVDTLLDMEENPITIDRGYLRQARRELTHWISVVSSKIYSMAGREFQIDSPKEVGDVLEGLGIELEKTDKGNKKTDAKTIERLAPQYPIVAHILLYRSLVKERSTYVDALLKCTDENTPSAVFKFRSVGAPTGRFASGGVQDGDPLYAPMNVQSIPSASKYRNALCHKLAEADLGLAPVEE